MRCAASGPGWHERFLNPEEASGASSAAHALAQGHSIIELAHVATAAECEALRAAASATAATERRKRESSRLWSFDGSNGIDRIRLPVLEHFCERMNGADVDGSTLCDALLVRACARAAELIAESDLFSTGCLNKTTCLHNKQLGFSLGEPAINVYTKGGRFKPHKDRQSLTILIPLSVPEAFDGGGTSFWKANDCSGIDVGSHAPSFVLKPHPGAAVLFGGSVTHAGQPVTAGERCVLVASFSPVDEPLPDVSLGCAPPPATPAVIVAGWTIN